MLICRRTAISLPLVVLLSQIHPTLHGNPHQHRSLKRITISATFSTRLPPISLHRLTDPAGRTRFLAPKEICRRFEQFFSFLILTAKARKTRADISVWRGRSSDQTGLCPLPE
ncbi:hypothetical protein HPP92_016214 [Vanilla planifolia]|uniref:Secreted protein n=1 Tax=Vanilla planifolia TaxID=51239 RepID=A0A835URW0_VANPL|nr:hypothetical protein HPP92_016214 [Vanilla planifolia]